MSNTKHYVDNEKFLEALKERKNLLRIAEEAGEEPPQISNYLGECILKIATHLSYKSNFINYTYREDMVLDGVQTCIQYLDNFDPEKSSNPFAYYTQIIYYAFIRRIHKEKKQSYIKSKLIQDIAFESFEVGEHDEDGSFTNAYVDFLRTHSEPVELPAPKKKKKKENSLENFMDEEQ